MRNSAGIVRCLALFALASSTLGCEMMLHGPGGAAAAAEQRVETVLAGMQQDGDGTSTVLQEAICTWYNGKRSIADRDEAETAMDGFDRWTRERGMDGRRIASYSIVESEMIEGADPEAAVVTVEIEGKTHRIRVPADAAMSWERGG